MTSETHDQKLSRLKAMLKQVTPGGGLEELVKKMPPPGTLGQEANAAAVTAQTGLVKLNEGRDEQVTPDERMGLEAIILPRLRPVVFVKGGIYDRLAHDLWKHLNDDDFHARLDPLMASVGRIELPNSSMPYGGTGFVVGSGLVMTNRHVAKIFTDGVGTRRLIYRAGDAAIDFKREKDTPEDQALLVAVKEVAMVHPYWDMALLRVEGLPDGCKPLPLSVRPPDELAAKEVEVAAVGYPALDPRNNVEVQHRVFQRVYEVKRFQPGKVNPPRQVLTSFGHRVNAMTHDSSTLGGNSGSAVIDLKTGEVVGLHFGGRYLDANYAVPTSELARDARVVDTGLAFANPRPPTGDDWGDFWDQADEREKLRRNSDAQPGRRNEPARPGDVATWTIPIRVSVTIGHPVRDDRPGNPAGEILTADDLEAWPTQRPKIYPNLRARAGYNPAFLGLPDGEEVPLPELTSDGGQSVAPVEDGGYELKYHHFSIVMHKTRRLALFTAANVDWRRDAREVDGKVPTRKQLTEIPDRVVEEWVTDRRIAPEHQLPDVFFTKDRKAWDKGHLVRRDDVCWAAGGLSGERKFKDIQKANGDTYHTTNCSPQVMKFNQASKGEDNWGHLENMIERETRAEKVILFSGPVLAEDDREFQGWDQNGEVWVPIPSRYWKVVVAAGNNGPLAFGFVLEQDFTGVRWTAEEFAVPAGWRNFMRPISEIEKLLFGLATLPWLTAHDGYESDEGVRIARRLKGGSK